MTDNGYKYSFQGSGIQRIVLIGLMLATYGISLANGFVWDDNIFFVDNPVYSEFNLRAILFTLANGQEYLPLRDLTYALDHLFWGKSPAGFHLTNLLMFAGNVLLVYSVARQIFHRLGVLAGRPSSPFLSFAVAAGFALHPINAEAVNFITCRNVLVSGFFFFLACSCMIRVFDPPSPAPAKWYCFSLLSFFGAMLGKATAIMLPLLLLVILPVLFPGRLKRILFCLAPFFAVAAGFYLLFKKIAVTAGSVDPKQLELTLDVIGRKIAVAVQLPFFYLGKLLFPRGFSVEYGINFSQPLTSPTVSAALAALLLLVILVCYCRSKLPDVVIGICWFLVALIPALNFFGTHPVVADRYAFLPAFGFMLAAVAVLERFPPAWMKPLLIGSLIILLAGLSVARSRDWRSNETLWLANIRNFPNDAKSYSNLASHYFATGEKQKALDLLAANNKVPWLNLDHDYFLGCFLLEKNDLARAKEAFQKPLNVVSGFIGPLYYLGIIAETEQDYVAAAQFYNRALASEQPDGFLQLPKVRTRLNEVKRIWLDRHILSMQQRLAANPDDLAVRRDLALTLDRLGFYAEALQNYLKLEQGGVKNWQIYQNIANCYFNMNRGSQAASNYEKVIALGGVSEDAYTNLGVSYRKLEQFDKAIKVLSDGVRLFPESPFPAYNLAVTYYAAGLADKARSSFAEVTRKFPELKDRTAPYLLDLSK